MSTRTADIIIEGARVRTMLPGDLDGGAPRSIAIAGGRILGVGAADAVREAFRGSGTRIDDAAGRTITPGLIDAHLHPIQGVDIVQGVDLGGLTDLRIVLDRLREEAARVRRDTVGGWVRAWNLDYAAFEGTRIAAATIDEALGDVPALLYFFDVHTALVNTAGLAAAGITGARTFEDTSEVVVDADGRPTGELREESAYADVLAVIPKLSREETLDTARRTLALMRRSGLTGGAIMDGNTGTLDLLEALDATGSGLPVRIVSAVDVKPAADAEERARLMAQRDRGGDRWRGGMIKLYADGVIDSGTGWLYEPDTHGEGTTPFWADHDAFVRTVAEFTAAGFQIATHAIGDRAVGETISAYEAAGLRAAGRPTHRIEHLECLDPRDIARLAATGVTASMQLMHMQWRIPDGSDAWSERLGPDRAKQAWNAGSVLRAGAPLALGSDWPIAELDARVGLAWAMLRRTPGDRDAHVYEPEERLTALEALHGYTRGAALAQGDDDLGVIREGAHADLAVWEEDPALVSGDEILHLPVTTTYLAGVRDDAPTSAARAE
ncbi:MULTISPECIES: amidohydrolase [unclassified Leucobacter]|uniref:amidohydrolase n=1 Tax=unclassified Leucobacter TaxID=2621730 RepID=UPI0006993DB1|nr:amidohydrolase [Leucobacter sp. Ag1]